MKFTGSLYYNTVDVNALWERLKEKTKICYPIENFDYGMREFAVFELNGYLLQFGQPSIHYRFRTAIDESVQFPVMLKTIKFSNE